EQINNNPWESRSSGTYNTSTAPKPTAPNETDNDVASIISGLSGANSNLFGKANSVFAGANMKSSNFDEAVISDSGSDNVNPNPRFKALSAISAPTAQHKSRFAANLFGSNSVAGVPVSSFGGSALGSSNFMEKFASVTEKTRELEMNMNKLSVSSQTNPIANSRAGNNDNSASSDHLASRRSSVLMGNEMSTPPAVFREPRKQSFSEKLDTYINSPNNSRHLSFSSDINLVKSEHNSIILEGPNENKNIWNPATAATFRPSGFEGNLTQQQQQQLQMQQFQQFQLQQGNEFAFMQQAGMIPPFGMGPGSFFPQMPQMMTPPPFMGPIIPNDGSQNNPNTQADNAASPSEPAPALNPSFYPAGMVPNRAMSPFVMPPFNPYNMFVPPSQQQQQPQTSALQQPGIIPGASSSPAQSNSKSMKKGASPKPVKQKKHIVRSPLLEEFRNNKSKEYTLKDIYGHGFEFAKDQHGSRFIQQQLTVSSDQDKEAIFNEIRNFSIDLMTDVFGNYVIQKYFEYGNTVQRKIMFESMRGSFNQLSLQMYGCRVVQKCLEVAELQDQLLLLDEVKGNILNMVKDQNGNHVIQKSIECMPIAEIPFILESLKDQIYHLSTHPYGCRVIQRLLEFSNEADQKFILDELKGYIFYLIQDQFGNYVIQHIIEHGTTEYTDEVLKVVLANLVELSKHKFASNAVEKCIIYQNVENRVKIYNEILKDNMELNAELDENSSLSLMMKDPFANYVVQKMVELIEADKKKLLIMKIREYLELINKGSYGKHLASIEKLIALSETYPDAGSSSETILDDDEDLQLDDIFNKLYKLSKTSDESVKQANEREKFEELKSSASKLPTIKTTMLDNPTEYLKSMQKQERISQIKRLNDPITSLPKNTMKKQKEPTATEKWFSLPKVELTEKLKRDLTVLKNRSSIDPKRHYKKDASWKIPENFQIGTIVGSASDYYNRINRKDRGTGFVEELLKDSDSKKWFKRKYNEVQVKKTSGGKRFYKDKQEKRKRA
ncbi:hypothetical protein CANARDRAFT_203187, partial [[Candida] arabinofermentans NRRL YB-2248]